MAVKWPLTCIPDDCSNLLNILLRILNSDTFLSIFRVGCLLFNNYMFNWKYECQKYDVCGIQRTATQLKIFPTADWLVWQTNNSRRAWHSGNSFDSPNNSTTNGGCAVVRAPWTTGVAFTLSVLVILIWLSPKKWEETPALLASVTSLSSIQINLPLSHLYGHKLVYKQWIKGRHSIKVLPPTVSQYPGQIMQMATVL